MVDNKILGGAGGFIQVTYFICVTYCHLACLKRHSIVCEWLLNLLRWLQVVPSSYNYELFAVNDNSKTAKYDMIHAYLCSRLTSVGQDAKIRAAITLPMSKLTVALSGKTKFRTHFERRFVSPFEIFYAF